MEGFHYSAFNLKHQYVDAYQFCRCRNQQILPYDIGDATGTASKLEYIANKLVESGQLHGCDACDIAIWLPYRNYMGNKWIYEYFNEIERAGSDIEWSVCDSDLGLDRHHNQPWGDDQNCLAYHYDPQFRNTVATCAWGMYDQKCYDNYENYYDYDHRLTICTDLPASNILPGTLGNTVTRIRQQNLSSKLSYISWLL